MSISLYVMLFEMQTVMISCARHTTLDWIGLCRFIYLIIISSEVSDKLTIIEIE